MRRCVCFRTSELFAQCVCLFSYPDLVVYELAGQVHLLGGASDGEDPGVGVGGGRGVPLQLHVSSRLLVNTLNGFTTCAHTHGLTLYYTFNEGSHNVSNLKGQFTQNQKYVSYSYRVIYQSR